MKKAAFIILAFIIANVNAQEKIKNPKAAKPFYPGYKMSGNGLCSKFYKQDKNGVKAKEGDLVKLYLSYKTSKDSLLFDSKMTSKDGTGFIEFPVGKSTFKGSFEDALLTMASGDSASFIINADSVYLKTFRVRETPAFIERGSSLIFEVKLEKITPKDIAEKEQAKKMEEKKTMTEQHKNEEPKAFAKYLADNKVTVKPTASGLYFIEKQKGNGSPPAKGNMVKVNYTGRLLDGTVFDTSDEAAAKQAGLYDARRPYEPIEFPLGVGQVIPGWDEGIALLTTGAKGQLIIPSSLGYGEQGAGPIPPFSALVFDVELVSFTAAQ